MGNQLEFFQAINDETELLKMIFESGYSIANEKGEILSLDDAINSKELSLFIVLNNSNIIKSNNGFIDAITSEAIQYSRGLKRDNQIQNSRLWVENKYFDNQGLQKKKSKEFEDIYNSIIKWIKNNYIKSDCQNYYIGNEAYIQFKEKDCNMLAGPKHFVKFS